MKGQNTIKNNIASNNLELTDSLILSIFLEHPILLEKFSNQIIDIVKDPDVKEMLVSIQDMKVNNTFQLNKFLEIDGTKKIYF